MDTVAGTAGNDTINAGTAGFLSAFDNIDGGAGTDTLNVLHNAATLPGGMTIKNVETININNQAAGMVADVSGFTGLTQLTYAAGGNAGATSITAASTTSLNLTGDTDTGAAGTADVTIIGGGGTANVVASKAAAANDVTIGGTAVANAFTSVSVEGGATVSIQDRSGASAATGSTLTSVTINGAVDDQTITANGLTTLNLTKLVGATTVGDTTVTAAAGTRALTVTYNGVDVGGGGAATAGTLTMTDATATTLNIKAATAKSYDVTTVTAAATAVTVDATVAFQMDALTAAAAKTVAISGAGAVTIAADTLDAAAVITSTNTGGVTLTQALLAGQQFVGTDSTGNDSISVATTSTVANSTGAGDDTVIIGGAFGTGGSVDAGEGTDTLSMTAAVAESVSAGTTFEAGISNFEKVKIGAALGGQTDTIDMANLDDINYVISAGGTAAVADVPEVQTITLGTLVNSQAYTLTVNGTAYTTAASDADTTAAELLALIQGHADYAAAPFTAALNADSTALVITFKANQGAITPLSTLAATGYITATAVETTAGVTAVTGGALAINNLASGGTFELTGAIAAASSVAVKDAATGSSDVLNIKLNGANQIVNAAALTVSNVETINIEATDSAADTTTLDNPSAASTVLLNAAAATKIVVTGNHGVDFTGSTLTKVVELDASGVVSVGDAAGATAAQIATTGAVTFSSVVADKAVTVKTGNGADVISVASVNDATFLATGVTASTVTTGEGNDSITGSAGKDVIDAGAGNDTITSGAGLDTVDVGTGDDTFVVTANANGNTYATITGMGKGDKIDFIDGTAAGTFTTAKITLAGTAAFADFLSAAAASTAASTGANGLISWFQYGGDTYIVEDKSTAATFTEGTDQVVKLVGLVDLSTATIDGATTNVLTLG